MTSNSKSYVQIASNSLTLDDLDELMEKARKTDARLAEKSETRSLTSIVTAHAASREIDQPKVSATEMYEQVHEELGEPNVRDSSVSESPTSVDTCSVPLVRDTKVEASQPGPEASRQLKARSLPQKSDSRLRRVQPSPVQAVPFIDVKDRKPPQNKPARNQNVRVSQEPNNAEVTSVVASEPVADLQEKPGDWLPDIGKEERRTSPETKPNDVVAIDPQGTSQLAQEVLDEFPIGPSCFLLVADVDGKTGGNDVANLLAVELASKNVGKVLLVDSHFEKRALTEVLAPSSDLGVADVISMDRKLDEAICETDHANLDFLPAGTPIMCRRRDQERKTLVETVRKVKNDYQFTVVAVGSVFEHATAVWARHCEGTYLTVSLNNSNQTVALTGVQRLEKHGARLMGCVVTDAA